MWTRGAWRAPRAEMSGAAGIGEVSSERGFLGSETEEL